MSEDAYEIDETGEGADASDGVTRPSGGLADLARGALQAGRHESSAADRDAEDLAGLSDVSIDHSDEDWHEDDAAADAHVDNADSAQDDAAADELGDGFDDDTAFEDGLDDFMSEDPEEEDLVGLDDVDTLDDAELGEELDEELELQPKRGGNLSAAARRAIEERAEQRRMERDLNYLDFELDD